MFFTVISGLILLRLLLSDLPTLYQHILRWLKNEPVDLKNRYGNWALVTGASDGIGKAYCAQLASRKINLVLVGRNKDKLLSVSNDLKQQFGVETKICIADFSKGREIYDSVRHELENVDVGILVNNVGIQYHHPMAFADLPEDEIWDNVNVNITSATMMTRIVLPKMIINNRGAIVNVASIAAYTPIPYMNLYAASKAYNVFFSEALRQEVKNTGITVQTLIPGYVFTKINHFSEKICVEDYFIPSPEKWASEAIKTLGSVDYTSAYWPHSIQRMAFISILPKWVRVKFLASRYKAYGLAYLRKIKAQNST